MSDEAKISSIGLVDRFKLFARSLKSSPSPLRLTPQELIDIEFMRIEQRTLDALAPKLKKLHDKYSRAGEASQPLPAEPTGQPATFSKTP